MVTENIGVGREQVDSLLIISSPEAVKIRFLVILEQSTSRILIQKFIL